MSNENGAVRQLGPRCTCGQYDWLAAVAAQMRHNSERVALRWSGGSMTYSRLEAYATTVARRLTATALGRANGREVRVGMCLERSWRAVALLLGIFAARVVYVPLDPRHPPERLVTTIRDAELDMLVVDASASGLRCDEVSTLSADDLLADPSFTIDGRLWAKVPQHPCRCETLAYMIYTSGSTGTPKAVLVQHGNLAACLEACQTTFGFQSDDIFPALAPFSFDISLFEVLNPLMAGGSLWISAGTELLDAARLGEVLPELTMLHAVPSLMRTIVSRVRRTSKPHALGTRLRALFVGGDRVPPDLLDDMRDAFPGAVLYVLYGPTETTIIDTYYRVPAEGPIDHAAFLGTPLPGSIIRVVPSREYQGIPEGAGEIWIGGVGVTSGYWRHEALTRERFVTEHGTRYYRTGDLGYRRADGNLVFLGRADRQVKLRGYRVELGEVEAALRAHPAVLDAVVEPRTDATGEAFLAAWIVPVTSHKLQFWPSLGEYPVYDEFIYRGLTNDATRNARYFEALRATAQGKVVVDLGTGADAVLARLAVQAGARRVYALEIAPSAARAAEERIAREGLTDRISVILGDARVASLPEAADVCVSEIFESIAGSEGGAEMLHALRTQLARGCAMIPVTAMTMIAAVKLPDELRRTPRFDPVAAYYAQRVFQAFGRPFDIRLCIKGASQELLLTGAGVVELIQLQAGEPPDPQRTIELVVQRDGILDGFLLWLRLETLPGQFLDTLEVATAWFPAFVPAFDGGVHIRAGDTLMITCRRQLSEDGLHPAYSLTGALQRVDGGRMPFELDIPYVSNAFRASHLYRELFEPEGSPAHWPVVEAPEVRRHVGRTLPSYMMPRWIMLLDHLPLTPNGKVDRAALPDPRMSRPATLGEYIPPRNDVERDLVDIWEHVLDLRPIGVRDSFFELGGQSLAAVRLVDSVRERLRRVLPLATLYRAKTIEQLVTHLQ